MFWTFHHPAAEELVGVIPYWLSPADPRSAVDQIHGAYSHGGGWRDFQGFTLGADNELTYPGDPSLLPVAEATLRDELILVYRYAWVAVVAKDRTFRVARID